jgi:hypothetical protein
VNGEIYWYPNPVLIDFTRNTAASKVEIHSFSGQFEKSFNANQVKETQFPISDVNMGLYIAKTLNGNNKVKVIKLVKQ